MLDLQVTSFRKTSPDNHQSTNLERGPAHRVFNQPYIEPVLAHRLSKQAASAQHVKEEEKKKTGRRSASNKTLNFVRRTTGPSVVTLQFGDSEGLSWVDDNLFKPVCTTLHLLHHLSLHVQPH